tara:strand:+ start:533 stop:763 length:231 start_codon:yes stop_codon:yes gene_type:complete
LKQHLKSNFKKPLPLGMGRSHHPYHIMKYPKEEFSKDFSNFNLELNYLDISVLNNNISWFSSSVINDEKSCPSKYN